MQNPEIKSRILNPQNIIYTGSSSYDKLRKENYLYN